MKNKKKVQIGAGIICSALVIGGSIAYASDDIMYALEDVFDGYNSVETTVTGKLGYNYAVTTPDGKKDLIFGFSPSMANKESAYSKIFDLGSGWGLKIPFIEWDENKIILHKERGQEYVGVYHDETETFELLHYPSEYTFVKYDDETYLLEEGYGAQTYFTLDGRALKSVDELGNVTEYEYADNGKLSKICFSDDTFVVFDRTSESIFIDYLDDNNSAETLAAFNLEEIDEQFNLMEIESDFTEDVTFDYISGNEYGNVVLAACKEDEKQYIFSYESNLMNGDSFERITKIGLEYEDGTLAEKTYKYNDSGLVEEIVAEDLTTHYSYEFTDDSLQIETRKETNGDVDSSRKTFNNAGQLIEYETNNSTIQMKYNDKNQLSKMTEEGESIKYHYSEDGLCQSAIGDDRVIEYSYYNNGQIKVKKNGDETIYYDKNGDIKKIVRNAGEDTQVSVSDEESDIPQLYADNIEIDYNINNEVGVTNYMDYYGLDNGTYNCYTFAIGEADGRRDPGYYADVNYAIYDSMKMLKLAVEEDQESLGRSTMDTTVGSSISAHQWKIAFRIRTGYDYHFMMKSKSSIPWRFKAGWAGPVMQLLGSKNPNNVSWDQYEENNSGEYEVTFEDCYNSETDYLMILD